MTPQTEIQRGRMQELLKHMESAIFNETERAFLRELVGKPYARLSKHQKAVLERLWTFFKGT